MNTQSTELQSTIVQYTGTMPLKRLLHQLFQHYAGGFAVALWNGDYIRLGRRLPAATITFTIRKFYDV